MYATYKCCGVRRMRLPEELPEPLGAAARSALREGEEIGVRVEVRREVAGSMQELRSAPGECTSRGYG